jgi:hypothetical protein
VRGRFAAALARDARRDAAHFAMASAPVSARALQLVAACDATRTEELQEAGERALRAFRDAAPELAAGGFEAHIETLAAVVADGADAPALKSVAAADAVALLRLAHRLCAPARATELVARVLCELVLRRPWPLHVLVDLSADEARLLDRCVGVCLRSSLYDAPCNADDLRALVAALTRARPVLERGELSATLDALLRPAAHVVLSRDWDSRLAAFDAEYWRAADAVVAARIGDAVVSHVCADVQSALLLICKWPSPSSRLLQLRDALAAGVPPTHAWGMRYRSLCCARAGELNELARGAFAALVPPTAYSERFVAREAASPRLFRLMQAMGFPLSDAAAAVMRDTVDSDTEPDLPAGATSL